MLDVSVVEAKQRSAVNKNGNLSTTDYHTFQITDLSYRIVVSKLLNRSSEDAYFPSINNSSKNKLLYRSHDIKEIETECQLFNKFKSGIRILTSKELHGISTVLAHAYTGSDVFIKTIKKHFYFDDNPKKYDDWEYYLSYMKKIKHICLPCDKFCPYRDQCHHTKDILSTSKQGYHTTKRLANCDEQFYSIDEAAADFRIKFDAAMSTPTSTICRNIHVINSPTGVGKSTTVRNHLKENRDGKCLNAYPTNDLKNESYENALNQGIKAVKSPSLLEFKDKFPSKVWNHIQGLYQRGNHHAVMDYIRDNCYKERRQGQPRHTGELSA